MNELIESGDPRARVVGKQRTLVPGSPELLSRFDQLQAQVDRSRNGLPFPKGVHRFKSHEEADEWIQKMMSARAV